MSVASARDDAGRFADNFITLHAALALARASHADVTKKTEANNFYSVRWYTFEKGPIDADEVLSKLEADIKDKETAFAAAKEGLEEALERMHEGEKVLWWIDCERLFSSVEPLEEYKPVIETPDIEDDGEEGTDEDDDSWYHVAEGDGDNEGGAEYDSSEDDGAEEIGAKKDVTAQDAAEVEAAEVASEGEIADE